MTDKYERAEQLTNDFAEFAADYPQTAIELITGIFVGLLEYSVESQGGDSSVPIKLETDDKRDITIHARKGAQQ